MTEIDSLFIDIRATSKSADVTLDRLKKSLQEISSVNLGSAANNLTILADGLKNLRDVSATFNIQNFRAIRDALKNFPSMGNGADVFQARAQGVASGIRALTGVGEIPDFTSIKTLASAMSALGGKSATQAITNMPQMSSALQQMFSMTIPSAENIQGWANSIKSLGGKSATNAAANIPVVATELQKLTALAIPQGQAESISSLALAINKMGGKYATQAATNIPGIATGMRTLIDQLNKMPAVRQDMQQLVTSLGQLSANGMRLSAVMPKTSRSLNLFGNAAHRTRRKALSLASVIGKLYASFFMLRRAISFIKDSIQISADLTEVQNVITNTFGIYSDAIEEFSHDALTSVGMSELTAKKIASNFQAIGVAVGIAQDDMSDMSVALTTLAGDLSSFYNVEQDTAASALSSGVMQGNVRALRSYGLDLSVASMNQFALARGISKAYSEMTQQEKIMLRYQYVMERTANVQGDFVRTSDSWANQTRILSNEWEQFKSIIGEGFIQAFKPTLKALNQGLAVLIENTTKALNALGMIFGWHIDVDTAGLLSDIDDDAESLEDAMTGTAKKTKEFKNFLLGIDELNLLPDNSDNSPNGGSSSDDTGIASALNDLSVNITKNKQKYWSFIDNFFDFGDAISTKIEDALNNIDWTSIRERARRAGKHLAQFLNGLFDPNMFYAMGTTIAQALNTGLEALYGFGSEFNWEQWGIGVSENINGFFDDFDFALLAQTLNVWAQGLWDALKAAVKNIDWKDVFSGIKEFFENLDIETVALIVGALTLKGVGTWLFGGGAIATLASGFGGALTKASGVSSFASAASGVGLTIAGLVADAVLAYYAGNRLGELMFPDDAQWYREKNILGQIFADTDTTSEAITHWWRELKGEEEFINGQWQEVVFSTEAPERWVNYVHAKLGELSPLVAQYDKWLNGTGSSAGMPSSVVAALNNQRVASATANLPKTYEEFANSFNQTNSVLTHSLETMAATSATAWSQAVEGGKAQWTGFSNWVQQNASFEIPETTIGNTKIGGGKIRIQKYASGGFPEDGLFYANHNELVGGFSNGQTAVANNGQIIAGIQQGVYNAMLSAMSQNGGGNVTVQLVGDAKSMFDAVVTENNRSVARTGKSPLRV